MTKSKIFVTGGSGKAGKHLIPYLLDKGYSVVNADLVPLGMEGVDDINLDITDSGQLFNALSGYANIQELKLGNGLKSFKAVVHLAERFQTFFGVVFPVTLLSSFRCKIIRQTHIKINSHLRKHGRRQSGRAICFKMLAICFHFFLSFLKCSDLLGPIRMHSDTSECIRMLTEAFGCARKK